MVEDKLVLLGMLCWVGWRPLLVPFSVQGGEAQPCAVGTEVLLGQWLLVQSSCGPYGICAGRSGLQGERTWAVLRGVLCHFACRPPS